MLYKLTKPNHEFDFNGMVLEGNYFDEYGDMTIDANRIFELNKDAMSKEQIFNLLEDGKDYFYTYSEYQLEVLKPKSIYELSIGDEYWYINSFGDISKGTWENTEIELKLRANGFIFLTREETEFDLKRREIEQILLKNGGRREFKFDSKNWSLFLDERKALNVWWNSTTAQQGAIYFDTEELAQQVVVEAGVDNVKKYIFRVGE